MKTQVPAGSFFEGQDITVRARVTDDASSVLVSGDIASYTVDLYDLTADPRAESPVYEYSSSTSSEVVFDTLQKDGGWSGDSTGYNFKYVLKHEDMAPYKLQGSHLYRLEVWLQSEATPSTSANTGAIPVIVDLKIVASLKKK